MCCPNVFETVCPTDLEWHHVFLQESPTSLQCLPDFYWDTKSHCAAISQCMLYFLFFFLKNDLSLFWNTNLFFWDSISHYHKMSQRTFKIGLSIVPQCPHVFWDSFSHCPTVSPCIFKTGSPTALHHAHVFWYKNTYCPTISYVFLKESPTVLQCTRGFLRQDFPLSWPIENSTGVTSYTCRIAALS